MNSDASQKSKRICGILLHPTSLPGHFGIGDLGAGAYQFIDFLYASGVRLWQVLPLGPTGYGDSPYQCFSAFAGNPLLINLEDLVVRGILDSSDLTDAPDFPTHQVDYGRVINFRLPLLAKAWSNFCQRASSGMREEYQQFCEQNSVWLEDFALFRALKEAHNGLDWYLWEPDLAKRRPEILAEWRERLSEEIGSRKFWQFLFFRQWAKLKQYCADRKIQLMGDIPIFVAHDSAEVWAHPELFLLEEDGHPSVVAGVPPDYFSSTGQLWGNPLYNWEYMSRNGFQWWVDRFRSTLNLVDWVRLDHFRGFEAYWEIPGEATNAVHGQWVKGPGASFFSTLENALGRLPIVAENLGFITPQVEALREQFGFPGMAVLQFAFGVDHPAPQFKPHNFSRNLVVYTGTHDNDTTLGWWTSSGAGDSTRTSDQLRREKECALKYLGCDGTEIHWSLIRAALASVADVAIIPLQDVLGLGSEARMNLPGRPDGNWVWRYPASMLTAEIQERLKELTTVYER